MTTKATLNAQLRSAKSEEEKLQILESAIKEQRQLVAQKKREAQVAETAAERKNRNKALYSLGVGVLNYFQFIEKSKINEQDKTTCLNALSHVINSILNFSVPQAMKVLGQTVLQPKDVVRLIDALKLFKIPYNPKAEDLYNSCKAQQKERAAKMREARKNKRAQATNAQA